MLWILKPSGSDGLDCGNAALIRHQRAGSTVQSFLLSPTHVIRGKTNVSFRKMQVSLCKGHYVGCYQQMTVVTAKTAASFSLHAAPHFADSTRRPCG